MEVLDLGAQVSNFKCSRELQPLQLVLQLLAPPLMVGAHVVYPGSCSEREASSVNLNALMGFGTA